MPEQYRSFLELQEHEQEGVDFRRFIRRGTSGIAIIAPHGGKIEPGTSEIARAIAGDHHSLYLLEGTKTEGNWKSLHVASDRFDDPDCLDIIAGCSLVVAIHGKGGSSELIQYGGLDTETCGQLRSSLEALGFRTDPDIKRGLEGVSKMNICNRSLSGKGVQLELQLGLRDRLARNANDMGKFCQAVINTLHGRQRQLSSSR